MNFGHIDETLKSVTRNTITLIQISIVIVEMQKSGTILFFFKIDSIAIATILLAVLLDSIAIATVFLAVFL